MKSSNKNQDYKIINKHKDFWKIKQVENPLLGKLSYKGLGKKPYPILNGENIYKLQEIKPNDIDIDRLLGLDKKLPEAFNGEIINAICPIYPEAWMESIIGCSIYASDVSCVARPVNIETKKAIVDFDISRAIESGWIEIMDKILIKAESVSNSTIAVRQLHLRGIIDMLAAYLGEERMSLALYDYPYEIENLCDKFSDLYINIVKRGLKLRSVWNKGYVSSWKLFAPGPNLDYQIDASSIISPKQYEKHILKYDKKIIKEFPFSLVHLHACGLNMLNSILKIDELKAIEISPDKETHAWDKEKIIESCEKIQNKSKSVCIYGKLTEDEVKEFKERLNSRGLAIFYWDSV